MFTNCSRGLARLGVVLFAMAVASSAAFAAQYTMRYAFTPSESSPEAVGARLIKHYVEEKSGGAIEVKIYPASSLGGESQILEQLRAGGIQAAHHTAHAIGMVVPASRLLLMPFKIDDYQAAYKVYDSDFVRKNVVAPLKEKGLVSVGMWCTGFRGFHTTKRIIHKPTDLQGLKIRVAEAPDFVDLIKTLGASPTPINWAEIYTALSQHVVDGTDTTQYYSVTQKLYEVVPYVTVLAQQPISKMLVFNEKWLNSLPPDLRKTVLDAGREMTAWLRRYMVGADVVYDDDLRRNGATVYYPTPEERQAFIRKAEPVNELFAKRYGEENVQAYLKLIKDIRAGKPEQPLSQ